METIDIFYQGHGIREIQHIEIRPDHTVAMILEILIEKHQCHSETILFLEDHEEPPSHHITLGELCGAHPPKVHVHHCRQVEVTVNFAGASKSRKFAPGATIARVKQWAAVHEFKMSEAEAGDHRLQIAGTHDRPSTSTHIGTLTSCPDCRIRFDLVPDERVNGGV